MLFLFLWPSTIQLKTHDCFPTINQIKNQQVSLACGAVSLQPSPQLLLQFQTLLFPYTCPMSQPRGSLIIPSSPQMPPTRSPPKSSTLEPPEQGLQHCAHSSRKGGGKRTGCPGPRSCPSANAFPSLPRIRAAQTRGLRLDTLSLRSNHSSHTGKPFPFHPQQPHFTQRQVHCNRNPFFSSTAPSTANLPRPGGNLTWLKF